MMVRRSAKTLWPVVFVAVFALPQLDTLSSRSFIKKAHARGKQKKRNGKRMAKSPPRAAVSEPSESEATTWDPNASTAELLSRARELYEALEYGAVIPVTRAVLERGDATADMRLDAYLLLGCALAIVGDPIEAEKPFRFLLRGRPDFDLPAEEAPKIVAVFRKVQVEERAILEQTRELQRRRIIKELELKSGVTSEGTGGLPIVFEYTLRDPGRVVDTVQVHYRRDSKERFSTLALQVADDGFWRAELPGEWTENESGFVLDYYVTTHDGAGNNLLELADAIGPLRLEVAPGTVDNSRIYESPWFWTIITAVAVGAGVGFYVLYDESTALPGTDGIVDFRD